ncbi:hypothetical protein ACIPJM_18290 [Streptomyces halstedii]|uniref:hypothetical protein n=1 Tax=Streptomyces halstedii TaxID=1944 RepID=UPI0037F53E5E
MPTDKIFGEKISTRVRVRPTSEEALRTARKAKAHAPHRRLIVTVYETKQPGRDAAEHIALADHLTAHGLALERLAGSRAPARDLRTDRAGEAAVHVFRRDGGDRAGENPGIDTEGARHRGPQRASTATDLGSSPTCPTPCCVAARAASPSSRSSPT